MRISRPRLSQPGPLRVLLLLLMGLLVSVPVSSQTIQSERSAGVRVIVRDATELPVGGAAVTLTARDGSSIVGMTNERGVATFESVRPDIYSGRVESSGFAPAAIDRLTVGAGGTVTREVVLHVAGFVEAVEVRPDPASGQLPGGFTRQLSADELAALPEDPEDLALVLQQLLGDDADIRVNGFSGGRLPPGSQIREVRIRYDGGAASSGGGPRVEIRTTPGGDRWRNNVALTVRDEAWSGRNEFTGGVPYGQTRSGSWNLYGPVAQDRT